MSTNRMVIAGGSGFIGGALAKEFSARGQEVIVFTRSPRTRSDQIREVGWDGAHPGEWVHLLEGAAAIINLTGKNINCPHTPANLRAITESRVNSVNALAAALPQLKTPPRVWVQASAVGIYGDAGEAWCDENSPVGRDALALICRQWEAAFISAATPQTRRVILRMGMVLGRDGGALPLLKRLTSCFLGSAVGNGRQYISWIHIADLAGMFVTAVENGALAGVLNAVAPDPVTNAEFMRELRRVLHRPWSPPAPAVAVKVIARLMGSDASLALVSQRCAPKRFLAAGLNFQYAELRTALNDLAA